MNNQGQKFDLTDAKKSGDIESVISQPIETINDTWFHPMNPYDQPVEPLDFIIDGFCARGMLTVIGGRAGSGKSMLTQYLLQLREQQNLLSTKQGRAIYLTGADSSETEIRRRAKSIGDGKGLYTVEIPSEKVPHITTDEFYSELLSESEEWKPDVIVFDTIADFHNGETNDAVDAGKTMHAFRTLAQKLNSGIVLLTHTRKSSDLKTKMDTNDISDSRLFTTKADFIFGIKSEYQNDSTNLIEMQCLKNRAPTRLEPIRAIFEYDFIKERIEITRTDKLFEHEKTEHHKNMERDERIKKAKELSEQGKSQREISELLGCAVGTVNNYLKSK